MSSWKKQLASQIPADWGKEIDIFETQIELRKIGKLDEKYSLKHVCDVVSMDSATTTASGMMEYKPRNSPILRVY